MLPLRSGVVRVLNDYTDITILRSDINRNLVLVRIQMGLVKHVMLFRFQSDRSAVRVPAPTREAFGYLVCLYVNR